MLGYKRKFDAFVRRRLTHGFPRRTDKGVCLPTVMLWLLFLYIEAAVRLRDLRHMPFHLDLCRPFAAHWYCFFLFSFERSV